MIALRQLLQCILHMCQPAWDALLGTLRLSCVSLLCALCLYWAQAGGGIRTLHLLHMAQELTMLPAGLLLIAAIGTVCLEEQAKR